MELNFDLLEQLSLTSWQTADSDSCRHIQLADNCVDRGDDTPRTFWDLLKPTKGNQLTPHNSRFTKAKVIL